MPDSIFKKEIVAAAINDLPIVNSPVMDIFYPEKNRKSHLYAHIAASQISRLIKNVPVVGRDSKSLGSGQGSFASNLIEPMPIKLWELISDKTLNDLRSMSDQDVQSWLTDTLAIMREDVRLTTEALCAMALRDGKIEYMMDDDGTKKKYTVDYGKTPQTFTATTKWNSSGVKLATLIGDLQAMAKKIREKGGVGEIVFASGFDVYEAISSLVLGLGNDSRVMARVDQNYVEVAGFKIHCISDSFTNYNSSNAEETVPKIKAKTIIASAVDRNHLRYCAVDDMEAGFQGNPFFVKQKRVDDPAGTKLYVQSKPIPLPNLDTTLFGTVL